MKVVGLLFIALILGKFVFGQGDLHVKGKIKSDSLMNPGFRVVIVDSSGTLDTLDVGLPGQVLQSNGLGQKPTWVPINTYTFDPHYPDGTDSLIAVSQYIDTAKSYTVPAGMNFYMTRLDKDPNAQYVPPDITPYVRANGRVFPSGFSPVYPVVHGPGTVIKSNIITLDGALLVGNLAPQEVSAISHDLSGNPYTVPTGKAMYIQSIVPWGVVQGSSIMRNNAPWIKWQTNFASILFIANEGDVISTDNPQGQGEMLMFGFLK